MRTLISGRLLTDAWPRWRGGWSHLTCMKEGFIRSPPLPPSPPLPLPFPFSSLLPFSLLSSLFLLFSPSSSGLLMICFLSSFPFLVSVSPLFLFGLSPLAFPPSFLSSLSSASHQSFSVFFCFFFVLFFVLQPPFLSPHSSVFFTLCLPHLLFLLYPLLSTYPSSLTEETLLFSPNFP